jgi:hypothetical protein
MDLGGQFRVLVWVSLIFGAVLPACGGRAGLPILDEEGQLQHDPGQSPGNTPAQIRNRALSECNDSCDIVADCDWAAREFSVRECQESCADVTDLADELDCLSEWEQYISCALDEFDCEAIINADTCQASANTYSICVSN